MTFGLAGSCIGIMADVCVLSLRSGVLARTFIANEPAGVASLTCSVTGDGPHASLSIVDDNMEMNAIRSALR